MVDFDRIKETGFFKALILTWKKSLFTPEAFFKELNNTENNNGILHPYFYAIIFTYINLVFSFFWDIFFFKIGFYKNYAILPKIPLFLTDKNTIYFFIVIGIIFLLLVLGILFTVLLILLTIVIHGFIMVMGGKKGIKNTFRIICYTAGVGFFSIFPIFGYNISATWLSALMVIGIKETNELSTPRSILAVLLPFIFASLILLTFLIKLIIAR